MKFTKKKSNDKPEISTASLPDIIFMLLFFFMVVTVMREQELMVAVAIPQATEVEKLENKSLVDHIYIGEPMAKYQEYYGSNPRLQLNNQISDVEDVSFFVHNCGENKTESDRGRAIASLRIDRKVKMGIVTDVKTELRKSGQLKINYSSVR